MIINYWEVEDDDLETPTQDGDGSNLLKQLRKAKRSDEKRIKELTEQLESLSKVQRERTVKEALEKKGVNPKAVRLILKDLDDVSEESVNNWLDDNADLFGIEVSKEAPLASEMDRAALRQQDILTQGAITPDRAEDMSMRIDNAQSAEEIINMIYSSQTKS
jgi:hypothetical protein